MRLHKHRTTSGPSHNITQWLWAVALVVLSAAPAFAQSVWELTPYRIHLITAMSAAPGLDAKLQADLEAGLLLRFETVIGASWDVSIGQGSPRLRNRMTDNMNRLDVGLLPKDAAEFDKIMLLSANTGGWGYLLCAREFDVRTQTFGPAVELPVGQTSKLCDAAFDAIRRAFVPLARIAESKGGEATLRLRAGGLPMRDKTLTPLQKGDIFRPLVRYIDRDGKLRRVVEVPWTYLVVEEIGPHSFNCKLHSAMHSPLTGRRRGRVEQLALAVRPTEDSTLLTLKARVEPHRPLCGYEVAARLPGSKKTLPVGRTDEQGAVTVPAVANDPLRILVVKCGGVLLARLPVVPGLAPSLSAEVPAVDKRLEAEGFVTGLQEELIDLVTRREMLIARAKRHIGAADWDQARQAVNELRSLQTRAELTRILNREREKFSVEDNWTKKKIDTLFGDTRKLLDKFLDPGSIEKIATELSQAREKGRKKTKPAAGS